MKLLWTISLLALATTAVAQNVKPLAAKPPVPADNPITEHKINLGRVLFFDPRLSVDGTISCNSCHNVMSGGTDGRSVSVGVSGQKGGRSSPTVFNAAFLSVQFWDGRAKSLEEQAKGPLTNPIEMGNKDHGVVIDRVKQIPGYADLFKKAFPPQGEINIDNLAKAIATYERTLITPNTPFDRYLKGQKKAISAQAQKGWETVQKVGCLACHSGSNFAGPELPEGQGFFMKFPTFPGSEFEKKYSLAKDTGKYTVTKNDADKNMWRVPTWRNIALTAPYFHNGSVQTLPEAVKVMAKTQLNRDLADPEVSDIVAFLETLSGDVPPQHMPVLPPTPGKVVVNPN